MHGHTNGDRGASIEFRNVTKRFDRQDHAAVADVNLLIEGGWLVSVVGPSGCGKTTILRMINRMLTPTDGTVLVDDIDTCTIAVEQLRRDIGYVIQQVGLFPHRTVAQNIATVPRLLKWTSERIDERVTELADLMRIDRSMMNRYPGSLSGGQQQRVGVARAMAAHPRVLLMDEPYSAVDPIVRAQLQTELLQLHRAVPVTIVVVTHDIDEAIALGDRVAVFDVGGRLAQFASPKDLLRSPADEFVTEFLGKDRQLRRLSLTRVGDLALHPMADFPAAAGDGHHPDAVRLDTSTDVRSAVDAMLTAGAHALIVTDASGDCGYLNFTELADRA